MANVISRRDFLKASSAVGLAAAINPASALPASGKKSRVVVATDTAAVSSSGSPNTAKIQDLVDQAIMAFTGKTDKAAAYEALFPQKPTASTKIFMKRNGASGTGAVNTAVTAAFQTGLQRMLNGSFPKANIDNPTKVPGNVSLKSNIDAANYLINCPVAWMHSVPQYGVTLSQKNTMNYDGDPFSHHNQNPPTWLHTVSLSDAIKPKQILALMDAIVGSAKDGPTTPASFKAGTIIVGSDIVAVDYQTLRLLEKQTGAITKQIATGDKNLKSAETAGLGTCTEANMEVIKISAPWPTVGTINDADKIMQTLNIRVLNQGNKIDFVIPNASTKHVSIFDMTGNVVWQSPDVRGEWVSWDFRTSFGAKVPSGMYVYRIACSGSIMRGTIMAAH
jgi:uncharacterized protein (DUF362 family)